MSGKFPQEIIFFYGVLRFSRDTNDKRKKIVLRYIFTKTFHMHVFAGVFLICHVYLLVIF